MIEKIAIIKSNERFFSHDIYIPESKEIEYIINGLAKLDGCEQLIPRGDIWKIYSTREEAEKVMSNAVKLIMDHTEKASDICYEIAKELEAKLKALIE